MWVQIGAALVVGAHGVGHVLGWAPVFGVRWLPVAGLDSWLVDGTVARVAAVLLFGLPTIGFLATAVGLWITPPWLRAVAVGSAAISLVACAVFPRALSAGSLIGCVLVNVAVLVVALRAAG